MRAARGRFHAAAVGTTIARRRVEGNALRAALLGDLVPGLDRRLAEFVLAAAEARVRRVDEVVRNDLVVCVGNVVQVIEVGEFVDVERRSGRVRDDRLDIERRLDRVAAAVAGRRAAVDQDAGGGRPIARHVEVREETGQVAIQEVRVDDDARGASRAVVVRGAVGVLLRQVVALREGQWPVAGETGLVADRPHQREADEVGFGPGLAGAWLRPRDVAVHGVQIVQAVDAEDQPGQRCRRDGWPDVDEALAVTGLRDAIDLRAEQTLCRADRTDRIDDGAIGEDLGNREAGPLQRRGNLRVLRLGRREGGVELRVAQPMAVLR